MGIEEIRGFFPMGSITISERGISAIYTLNDDVEYGWQFDDGVFDETGDKQKFLGLLELTDKLGFSCVKGKHIKIVFYHRLDGQNPVVYPPLKRRVSIEEFMESARQCSRSTNEDDEEFVEFFSGTDLDDVDEVMDKFREWVDFKGLIPEKGKVYNVDDISRWKELKRLVFNAGKSLACEYDIMELDGAGNATIEMILPEGYPGMMWIESLSDFKQAVGTSSGISFNGDVKLGEIGIVFYL